MTTTFTIIVLSALLLAAVFLLGRIAYISGRRLTAINSLKSEVRRCRMAADDVHAIYSVRRINAEDDAYEYNGTWAVCRTSCVDGVMHHSCVKIFTDEDDEFNLREAEELCDKLNEK